MSVPKIIKDVRDLKSLTGITSDIVENFIDEQGNLLIDMHDSIQDLREYIGEIAASIGKYLTPINLNSLNVGDLFYVLESGIPTGFIVVQKNYKNSGIILATRKYILPAHRNISNDTQHPEYNSSGMDNYLNGEYKALISGVTLSNASISCIVNNSTVRTLNRSIFLASYSEIFGSNHPVYTPDEGLQFDYYRDNANDRIPLQTTISPNRISTWSRSISSQGYSIAISNTTGGYYTRTMTDFFSVRPVLALDPNNSVYVVNNTSTNNVLATASLSE